MLAGHPTSSCGLHRGVSGHAYINTTHIQYNTRMSGEEEKQEGLIENKGENVDDSKDLEHKLNLYYRLKKVLEDENQVSE